MDTNTLTMIVTMVFGGGGLAALITALQQNKKSRAEGKSVEIRGELQIVDSAMALTTKLQEETQRLTERIEALEAEAKQHRDRIEKLVLENARLESENERLKLRVEELERHA